MRLYLKFQPPNISCQQVISDDLIREQFCLSTYPFNKCIAHGFSVVQKDLNPGRNIRQYTMCLTVLLRS